MTEEQKENQQINRPEFDIQEEKSYGDLLDEYQDSIIDEEHEEDIDGEIEL